MTIIKDNLQNASIYICIQLNMNLIPHGEDNIISSLKKENIIS